MKKITLLLLFVACFKLQAQNTLANNQSAIGFIENKGQVYNQHEKANNSILYLLNAPGLNVQLRKTGFSYDFYEIDRKSNIIESNSLSGKETDSIEYTYTTKLHRVDFDFVGINQNVEIRGLEKSMSFNNYYNMPWQSNGIEKVYNYKKVIYQNLYKGIDLEFSIPNDPTKSVEYNFIIHAHGDINDIKFKVNGAKNSLEGDRIKFDVRFGSFEETIPLSWSYNDLEKKDLDIKYRQIRKNVYGFMSTDDLKGKKIIIDPVPIRLWGSYFGGYSTAFPGFVNTDALNNVYVSGSTASTEFVATEGTFQSTLQGGTNGYISKLNAEGEQIWGTYYRVAGRDLVIDSDFNVVILGHVNTSYASLTTPNAYQTVKGNYRDCFVAKLNSDGLRLWGTYYGGNGNDNAGGLSLDNNNNIYITGESDSSQSMATPGSHQMAVSGFSDGFIVKFSPLGERLWGTYFGGDRADGLFAVNTSDDGFIYVTGTANSGGLGTPGTYKPDWDGTNEIYIGKFDVNGVRIWSTYAGGSGHDYMFRSVLQGNNLYLQGRTSSSSNISTPGSFRPDYSTRGNDLDSNYIINFDVENQVILWGTYFSSQITSIDVNLNNELFFCGDTPELTGITTPDAYMFERGPYHKSFLIKLGTAGERIWGTYYGGERGEQNCFVAVDTVGDIYMHGITNGSLTGIATAGAHQATISPNNVGATYLVKFRDCNSYSSISSNSPVCAGQSINLYAQGGTNYLWRGPDNFTSTLQDPLIPLATTIKSGTYTCYISGTQGCDLTQHIEVIVGDSNAPLPTLAVLPDLIADCSVNVTQVPTATDSCDGIISATTSNALVYNIAGTYFINWDYTDNMGNTVTQRQNVVVNSPSVAINPLVQLYNCPGDNEFNLTEAQQLITTSAGATFNYYLSENDAQQETNQLSNIIAHTVTTDSELYVLVSLPGGCKAISKVILAFNSLPNVTSHQIRQCFGLGDQAFNLASVLSLIDPDNQYDVTLYASSLDMQNNNAISNFNNFITHTPVHIIQVKIVNASGCVVYTTIELKAEYFTGFNLPDYFTCETDATVIFNMSLQHSAIVAAIAADNYQFRYYDTYADAVNGTLNTIDAGVTMNTTEQTIYYRLDGANGCPYIVTQKMGLIENPDFDIESDYAVCNGDSVTIILPDNRYIYNWSNGITGPVATFTTDGNYSVTALSNDGIDCNTTKYFTITHYDLPHISNIVTTNFTGSNNTITVLPYNQNYLYSLDGISYQPGNLFSNLEAGVFRVYVKGECGVISKNVALFDYPKFFTPNADGESDYWFIKNGITGKMIISIYDRYGKLIIILRENERWDGTFKGSALPATDYWFIIQQENKPEFKGHFALIR